MKLISLKSTNLYLLLYYSFGFLIITFIIKVIYVYMADNCEKKTRAQP